MGDTQIEELGVIRIASPCEVPWSSMHGDDTVRHCGQCNLNVYNVENLSSYDVRELLMKREGRVCMRFFKRYDGTVLTKDCPRGLAAVGQVWRKSKDQVRSMDLSFLIFGAVMFCVFGVGLISLFGDNIRRLYGMTAGDSLGGSAPVTMRERAQTDADARAAVLTKFHASPPCPTRRAPEP
jgi:hypothetical protein